MAFRDHSEDDLDELPGLMATARFARMVPATPWFACLGNELDDDELDWARAYLDALGFPEAEVAAVPDWEEAELVATNPDWNTDWWEAEEAARMALIAAACERIPEDSLMVALTNVASAASDPVQGAAKLAAAREGVADEALIRAAAGAATQACYQAALVLAAEADDSHPFSLKFRLFESGRWPIGVIGGTFSLF